MAITLGLVEAVDVNGAYVSTPDSRGVLRGPYASTAHVVVGERVLLSTTDDGEVVVAGVVGDGAQVSVKAFGAKGDGTTDDTASINAAVAAAHAGGGGTVLFPPGTYLVDRIGLRSHIHYLGFGATIKASVTTHHAFDARLYGGPLTDTVIEGFRIDCGDLDDTCGVFLYDSSHVTICNNTVSNVSDDNGAGFVLWWLTENCKIVGNHVTLPDVGTGDGTENAAGIQLIGGSDDPDGHGGGWNDTLTYIAPNANYCRRHIVSGNTTSDGTHGIELIQATDNVVAGNQITGPLHRGILMSPIASRNVISGNQVKDFGSTGIHMANGSCDNMVSGNDVWTTSAISSYERDGIKAYYASNRNSIVGNRVTGTAARGIRMAMASTDFLIADNHIYDCPTGISIEAYIDSTNTDYYQPATPPDVEFWTVSGNHISGSTTGILLHQGNLTFDEGETQLLTCGVIAGNHVVDATTGVLFTENYTGTITDITATGNLLRATTGWDTPRGSAHFAADETAHP